MGRIVIASLVLRSSFLSYLSSCYISTLMTHLRFGNITLCVGVL